MVRRLRTSPQVLVAALVVSPSRNDHNSLRTIFAHARWKSESVPTIGKALAWLARCGPPQVVICERDLADGNWQDLFQQTETLPRPPKFIVTSRLADDHLWAEALNLGAHDVLSTPFDTREVSRVVQHAIEGWKQLWGVAPSGLRITASIGDLPGKAMQARTA